MHHDHAIILQLNGCRLGDYYKSDGSERGVRQRFSRYKSEAEWKECWTQINKRSLEPRPDLDPQNYMDQISNRLRCHREAFMTARSSLVSTETNAIWARWDTHLAQIFCLVTYYWALNRVMDKLGWQADEWTTKSVHQALLTGTKFDPNIEGSCELHVKQDEEIKYVSVEVGYPGRTAVPMPRYSVEPINRDALRATDELVQGSARRTDELVSGTGHHRHSEEVAMHAIWDTSAWLSEDLPRVKQEH